MEFPPYPMLDGLLPDFFCQNPLKFSCVLISNVCWNRLTISRSSSCNRNVHVMRVCQLIICLGVIWKSLTGEIFLLPRRHNGNSCKMLKSPTLSPSSVRAKKNIHMHMRTRKLLLTYTIFQLSKFRTNQRGQHYKGFLWCFRSINLGQVDLLVQS